MGPDVEARGASVRWTLRLLTAACVVLAIICAVLAGAWRKKDQEAACWRAAFEEDLGPAARDCAR